MTTSEQIDKVLTYLYEYESHKGKLGILFGELCKLSGLDLSQALQIDLFHLLKGKKLIYPLTKKTGRQTPLTRVKLTSKGSAIMQDFGSYIRWKEHEENKSQRVSGDTITITGGVYNKGKMGDVGNNANVNQGLRRSKAIKQAITNAPNENEKQQSAITKFIDILKTWWWLILVPVGIVLSQLWFEYKSGLFMK